MNILSKPVTKVFLAILYLIAVLSLNTLLINTVKADSSILLNDDFNRERNGKMMINYDKFTHWIVSDGNVDLVNHTQIGNSSYSKFGLFVDLDGSGKKGGTLTSRKNFALEPGTYELSFHLGNNSFNASQSNNTMTVSLGSVYSERFSRNGSVPFEKIVRTITVNKAQNATLQFEEQGNDHFGIIIDDVVLKIVAPDLVVDDIQVSRGANGKFLYTIKVKNIGTATSTTTKLLHVPVGGADMTNNYNVITNSLFYNNKNISHRVIPELKPNQEFTGIFEISAETIPKLSGNTSASSAYAGACVIAVKNEIDEQNNCAKPVYYLLR